MAEFPELEGIERMNPALKDTTRGSQVRERPSVQRDKKHETNMAQQQHNDDSLMKVLSALGKGVDPEIMERIAKRAFSQDQFKVT